MRYVIAALAVLTCPCHLPIAIALLGSTALGAAMTEHMALAVATFALLFVVSLWTAVRLFSRGPDGREAERSE